MSILNVPCPKLLANPQNEQSRRFLGIECDEIIHSILDVMRANAPYTVIQGTMHIHPSVTELIPTMLGELKPRANKLEKFLSVARVSEDERINLHSS